jgi:small-conductance mechanosensitive channel
MPSNFAKYLNRHHASLPLLCAILILAFSSASGQQPTASVPTELTPEDVGGVVETAPVTVDGMTLFSVRGVTAFPAQRRAQQIAGRIRAAAATRDLSPQSLRLEAVPIGTQILAGSQLIMTVLDADARLEGADRAALAQVFLSRIAEAIGDFRYARRSEVLIRHALYALAATLVFLLGLWIGRRAIRKVRSLLTAHYKHTVRGIQIKSFDIVGPEQLWRLLTAAFDLLSVLVGATVAYVYAQYVLSLFPWTRGAANTLLAILASPLRIIGEGLLSAIPNLVFLAILALITSYVSKLIRLFFAAVETGAVTLSGFEPEWAPPTYRLVRVLVVVLALVVAYPYIPGSTSDAFKGISLFIGVLFSLGSTSLINNMISGYSLAYRRAFKPGDRVKIGDHIGDVEETKMMVTYLRTLKNELVAVPNSMIVNGDVVNYSALARRDGLILHSTVGIGYETPWRQVEAMLLEAAARTPGLLPDPKPFVLQKELGDFAVTYEINAYCDQPRAAFQIYTALHQNVLDVFNEYGVQIMTPSYEGDPEQAKVVPKGQWYAAPALPPGPAESGRPKSGPDRGGATAPDSAQSNR